MITKNAFVSKTLCPKSLMDILLPESKQKRISVIEDVLQRPLVWDTTNIETLWGDIYKCIQQNIQNNSSKGYFSDKVYDKGYLNIGSIEYSEVENYNMNKLIEIYGDTFTDVKSVVDGSQRSRVSILMALAFAYKVSETECLPNVCVDIFKMDNGCYKIIEMGKNELSDIYNRLENDDLSKISKDISNSKYSIEKLEKKLLSDNEERNYFDIFVLFVRLIERDICGTFDLKDSFNIAMENVSFYEEYVDKDYKFERFVDRNKKGTPMSDESMYPKYIINNFENKEKLHASFIRFKEKAKECEHNNRFVNTKKGLNSVLFIMIEALKCKLGFEVINDDNVKYNDIFSSTFELKDIKYGVERCFLDKLYFRSEEETVDYFNYCYEIAEFLDKESFKSHTDCRDNYFYFRNTADKDCMWWYLIKPLFLTHTLYKKDKYEIYAFLKGYFIRAYGFYIPLRTINTNSQNFINLMEEVSYYLIKYVDNYDALKKNLIDKLNKYMLNYGGVKKVVNDSIGHLSYTTSRHKNAIRSVLNTIEYAICEECGFDGRNLIDMYERKGKKFELDHWKPKNGYYSDNEEYDEAYDKIGNLVLVEESLNKSKGCDETKNSKTYVQSNLYQTKLFDIGNRGSFYNKELDIFNNSGILCRFDTQTINSPTLENIKKRTNFIISFFEKFITNYLEKYNQ